MSEHQETMPPTDELNLREALRRGDEAAFDTLFRKWYTPLVRYALGFTDGDADEAEDLVQQAFFQLWQQRQSIDFQYNVKSYLYRMVHNSALNRLRAQRTHERFEAHQKRQTELEIEPPTGLGELETRFRQTLENLPAQCRQVFELSRFESLKYREIGEQLGISIKTVETHMGKALRIFRQELAEFLTLAILVFFEKY